MAKRGFSCISTEITLGFASLSCTAECLSSHKSQGIGITMQEEVILIINESNQIGIVAYAFEQKQC